MRPSPSVAVLGLALAGALTSALAGASAPVWRWDLPPDVSPPAVPADNPMTPARIELGRRLFYDADLSADGTMSCGTCHEQHRAFTEGNATHPGVNGERGRRNVPGLANVAWLNPLTSADPSLTSLEGQIAVPVFGTHPVEMGMAGREVEIGARLGKDDCYRKMFRRAFPEDRGAITFANTSKALAAFERTMVSFGSDYDRGQLTAEAAAGRAIFAHDCAACHTGPNFTDLGYHRVGTQETASGDPGLVEKSGRAEDEGKFRTPSLRNVMLTGPWWHDGTAGTIPDAIARHGFRYGANDQTKLLAFLTALSDMEFTRRPSLSLPDQACGKRL